MAMKVIVVSEDSYTHSARSEIDLGLNDSRESWAPIVAKLSREQQHHSSDLKYLESFRACYRPSSFTPTIEDASETIDFLNNS
jgi:hypothetical protein